MKIPKILTLCFFLFPHLSPADEAAVEAAKTHFRNILEMDYEGLGETYAPTVELMPGHEFLKEEYGLFEAGARAIGGEIASDKLIAAMQKEPGEKLAEIYIDRVFKTLAFAELEAAEGEFVTESSDPVGTADGKLHFTIKAGDVVVKIAPPRGDFLLLHLRSAEGKWKVVSEYFD